MSKTIEEIMIDFGFENLDDKGNFFFEPLEFTITLDASKQKLLWSEFSFVEEDVTPILAMLKNLAKTLADEGVEAVIVNEDINEDSKPNDIIVASNDEATRSKVYHQLRGASTGQLKMFNEIGVIDETGIAENCISGETDGYYDFNSEKTVIRQSFFNGDHFIYLNLLELSDEDSLYAFNQHIFEKLKEIFGVVFLNDNGEFPVPQFSYEGDLSDLFFYFNFRLINRDNPQLAIGISIQSQYGEDGLPLINVRRDLNEETNTRHYLLRMDGTKMDPEDVKQATEDFENLKNQITLLKTF